MKPTNSKYLGEKSCNSLNPCELGKGDCKSDEDCQPKLKCF